MSDVFEMDIAEAEKARDEFRDCQRKFERFAADLHQQLRLVKSSTHGDFAEALTSSIGQAIKSAQSTSAYFGDFSIALDQAIRTAIHTDSVNSQLGQSTNLGAAALVSPDKPNSELHASSKLLEFTATHEGPGHKVYKDQNGNWTVGVGHLLTQKEYEDFIKTHPDGTISDGEVRTYLASDIGKSERAVRAQIKTNLTQDQFDALTEFTFARGSGHLKVLLADPSTPVKLPHGTYSGHGMLSAIQTGNHEQAAVLLEHFDDELDSKSAYTARIRRFEEAAIYRSGDYVEHHAQSVKK